jgi:bifunctional non-homologous end joining protein LigD
MLSAFSHADGRPLLMKRYPDGIEGKSFYQKEIPEYAPGWLHSVTVYHRHTDKEVNYAMVTDQRSLIWLINQRCIEIHAWLSKADSVDYPDIMQWSWQTTICGFRYKKT